VKPLVLKFGGELLEDRAHLASAVAAVASTAAGGTPVVIVHGGGKEIDAALKAAGIEKRQVDGLRLTDAPTRDVRTAAATRSDPRGPSARRIHASSAGITRHASARTTRQTASASRAPASSPARS